jgi:GT2 family glycosyltransferase
MYFEDIDYCRSVNKEGLSIYYLPTAQVVHYHGASGQNLAGENNQWKRLIPSAKIYYGTLGYYIQWFITRTAQALGK